MTAFRGAADRIVAAQRERRAARRGRRPREYGVVLDHLYRAVQHLQSHDLVNQLIDAQKLRVDKMREKLGEAISLAGRPCRNPGQARPVDRALARDARLHRRGHPADRRRRARAPRSDKKHAGSVDLF